MSDINLRVVIDERAFRNLVGHNVVQLHTRDGRVVEAILADIGWDRMLFAIHEAMVEGEEPHELL